MRDLTILSGLSLLLVAGCDDAAGIKTIHFALYPPPHGEVTGSMAEVVSPLDARFATGTLDVMVDMDHLMATFDGLPVPADPAYDYGLWVASNEPSAAAEEDRDTGTIAIAEGSAEGEYQGRRAFRSGGAYDITFSFEDEEGMPVTQSFQLTVVVH